MGERVQKTELPQFRQITVLIDTQAINTQNVPRKFVKLYHIRVSLPNHNGSHGL